MGLDMRPIGKPKPGFEERFNKLFNIFRGLEKQELSRFDKLIGKKPLTEDELLEEWWAIQIPVAETIKAPIIGKDKEATEWLRAKYGDSEEGFNEKEFIKKHKGECILDLAK